ncbi:MAG: dihydrodipicolinate synthase family protein [Dehalococcoidia bacterium]|nr:dihydrodipicolinate synthase family protein [Dehalococcoidia bacterium]
MTCPVRGVFPPIPTPFTPDGDLALDRLADNLHRWNAWPLHGYVVLGSNGEFPLLSESEKLAVIERARSHTPADRLLIAGTGAESTRATIALTRQAATLGVDAVLVLTPHYFRPSYDRAAFIRHYLAVAESSPVPVLLYSVPTYSNVDLAVDVIVELSHHPNIVGYKESAPNVVKIAEVASRAAPHFIPLAGSGSFLYPAMTLGAGGGILALANVAGVDCRALYDAVVAGDHVRAKALQHRLLAPNAALTTRFGVAGVKAALDSLGWYGGPPRSPLAPLSDRDRAELVAILGASGILAAHNR